MKHIQFVCSDELETLEQYAASLVSGMISLCSLEGFHVAACRKGLLQEDEIETATTICWEIRRLVALYKTQIEHILERVQLEEQDILQALHKLMPDVKKKRLRK